MHNFVRSPYYEAESMCTVLRLECVYRDQKFYAQTRISDEYQYSMPPDLMEHVVNMEWLKLEKQLTQAMAQYDLENPIVKHSYGVMKVSKEELELGEEMGSYFQSLFKHAYQAKIKEEFQKQSYHASGPAMDFVKAKYIKPEPPYREKAVSEFEGVEDLDPTLWNEDGDLA